MSKKKKFLIMLASRHFLFFNFKGRFQDGIHSNLDWGNYKATTADTDVGPARATSAELGIFLGGE